MSEWWKYHGALPFQISSWEVLHFASDHMHIHAGHFKKWHTGIGAFWCFVRFLLVLRAYRRHVQCTAQRTKLLMRALVFYLFAMPPLYQAFNDLIILHWAQLKHNWLVLLQKSTSSAAAAARQLTKQGEREAVALGLLLCTWNKWDSVILGWKSGLPDYYANSKI